MSSLPPEVLARIFEFVVSPTTFFTFPIRSAALRSFALVARGWQHEAQRLLAQQPVVYPTIQAEDSLYGDSSFPGWTKDEGVFAMPHHLRVRGLRKRVFTLPEGVGTDFGGLSKLSLNGVILDCDVLLALPSLEVLSLHQVSFSYNPTSSSNKAPPHLTDLSISSVREMLPDFLLPSSQPRLRRLAHHGPLCRRRGRFDDEHYDQQYSYDTLVDIQDRLDFFSSDLGNDAYWHNQDEEARMAISDKTLFDMNSEMVYVDLDHLDSFEGSPAVKHLRITHEQSLGEPSEGARHGGYWEVERLKKMLTLSTAYPSVKTLVVPSRWLESKLFERFDEMVREREMVLLLEDEGTCGYGESLISRAFKEYRKKVG